MAWIVIDKPILINQHLHSFWSKWSETTEHFTNKYPKAPNIGLIIVASAYEDFRSCIRRCTTICLNSVFLDIGQLFREAKVNQFNVAMAV